jgi:recombination protein RecR
MSSKQIQRLINQISKLSGIGKRSAQRIAIELLENKEKIMIPLGQGLIESAETIKECEICGNFDDVSPCYICSDNKRDKSTICIVESVSDLWAMERGNIYRGQYHIIGGVLSAIEGVGPDDLNISSLLKRIENDEITEVILATNATLEGQTTAHYISKQIENKVSNITRLANGIPLGGELEYIDEGTLSTALASRKSMSG